MKPRVFLDIKTSRLNAHSQLDARIHLARRSGFGAALHFSIFRRPLKVVVILAVSSLLFGSALAPTRSSFAAPVDSAERAALEQQLSDLEAQIAQDEATAAAYQKQGNSLKSEIASLNAKTAALNLKIKAINISLDKLNREIDDNKQQISVTQDTLDLNREAIMQALQSMYESEQVSLITILLKHPNLSDFFDDLNNLMDVQTTLTGTIQQYNDLKIQLLSEKENLASKKSDTTTLKAFQDAQKAAVLSTKSQKDQLLTATKGNEQKYQQIVAQKKATAAQIRSRIFALLGGGQMTFEQAYEFAKYAQDATGVPASFLLAVLDRESKLGKNVGQCGYKTAMAPGPPKSLRDDVTPFLKITAELGLNPDATQVSCANADGAYGGAMGPAQFIPTTWLLYRDKIATITGDAPPSPWKNSDAFVGTALYLKDAMAGCGAYSGDSQIRCAAARYYAGGNWRTHLYTYGSATLSRKQQFDDDIATLTSNSS